MDGIIFGGKNYKSSKNNKVCGRFLEKRDDLVGGLMWPWEVSGQFLVNTFSGLQCIHGQILLCRTPCNSWFLIIPISCFLCDFTGWILSPKFLRKSQPHILNYQTLNICRVLLVLLVLCTIYCCTKLITGIDFVFFSLCFLRPVASLSPPLQVQPIAAYCCMLYTTIYVQTIAV